MNKNYCSKICARECDVTCMTDLELPPSKRSDWSLVSILAAVIAVCWLLILGVLP